MVRAVSMDLIALEDDGSEVSALVTDGQAMINKHRLHDAEECFQQALEFTSRRCIPPVSRDYQHRLVALTGLAEVYLKRSRMQHNDELEWYRLYLHALSSKRKAAECCRMALANISEDEVETRHWIRRLLNKTENKIKVLDASFTKSLAKRLELLDHKNPTTDETQIHLRKDLRSVEKQPDKINVLWLLTLQKYCHSRCSTNKFLKWESRECLRFEDMEAEFSIDADTESSQSTSEEQPRKIDFGKVSSAIQSLVKQISKEGGLIIHKDMSAEEKLNLLSPVASNIDVFQAFKEAIESPENEEITLEETLENGIHENSEDEADEEEKTIHLTPKDDSTHDSWIGNLNDFDIPFEQPSGDSGSPTLEKSVFLVWKRYQNDEADPDPTSHIPPYCLHGFNEISPITESLKFLTEERTSRFKDEDYIIPQEQTPNSEASLDVTYALSICNLADNLQESKDYDLAIELYSFAIGVLKESALQRKDILCHVASILTRLGQVKCAKGDFVGGCHLMEEGIAFHKKSDQPFSDFHVAQIWFEIGVAYMSSSSHEPTLYDHIMHTVKDLLESDIKTEEDLISVSDDESDDDDCSDNGDSYSISIVEALTCFTTSIGLLRAYPDTESNEYNTLLVAVLTKLGDCAIMQCNYDQATCYYEEAVQMFRTVTGPATLSVNAHVLSMLGTAEFFLHNYAKAVPMYECAHLLHQHLYSSEDQMNFGIAFNFTMLGVSYYKMEHYHKCISWCLKAFDLYYSIYGEDIVAKSHGIERWFITETLYTLGYSFGTLSLHDKAMHYLTCAHGMVKNYKDAESEQTVRILKAIADEHSYLEENTKALELYEKALELSKRMGDRRSATALQNQLLNRMAGIYVSNKDYNTAAEYLQQALVHQKTVSKTINDDFIGICKQLGVTYTLSGDIERAIDCYTDCIEAYDDMIGSNNAEKAELLGSLGTLYHVKACIQEDQDEMVNTLMIAEKNYRDALVLDPDSVVCVQYANYLYQQAQYDTALLVMLHQAHTDMKRTKVKVSYNGVEQAVLPEHLQMEIDDIDEVELDTAVFSRFLAILCYRQLQLNRDAEDCLESLVKIVDDSQVALNHSMVGYSMLEMNLLPEAAVFFSQAASFQQDTYLSVTNYWISLITEAYKTLDNAAKNIYYAVHKDTILEQLISEIVVAPPDNRNSLKKSRDSGYYDVHFEVESDNNQQPDWVEDLKKTQLFDAVINGDKNWQHSKDLKKTSSEHGLETAIVAPKPVYRLPDRGYYSSEYLSRPDLAEQDINNHNRWQSIESVDTYQHSDRASERLYDSYKSLYNEEESSPYYQRLSDNNYEAEHAVETPTVILEALQQPQQELPAKYDYRESEENVKHSEEVVETPEAILEILRQQQALERDKTLYREYFDKELSPSSKRHEKTSENISDPVDENEEETIWVTEEVVDTPMEILKLMKTIKTTDTGPNPISIADKNTSPCEKTSDTQYLNRRPLNNISSSHGHDNYHNSNKYSTSDRWRDHSESINDKKEQALSPSQQIDAWFYGDPKVKEIVSTSPSLNGEEDVNHGWVYEEETVPTPTAILNNMPSLLPNSPRNSFQAERNLESTQSAFRPYHHSTPKHQQSFDSYKYQSNVHQEPPSSSSFNGSHDSQHDTHQLTSDINNHGTSDDDVWHVTEEVVETPPEILAILQSQQYR